MRPRDTSGPIRYATKVTLQKYQKLKMILEDQLLSHNTISDGLVTRRSRFGYITNYLSGLCSMPASA